MARAHASKYDANESLCLRYQHGDRDAAEELLARNAGLVARWVRFYLSGAGSLDAGDLTQEGRLGLLTAARKFKPALGYQFSTYAVLWIRQAISRSIKNYGSVIRVPVSVQDTFSSVPEGAGFTRGQQAALAVRNVLSLDQDCGEGGTLAETLPAAEDVLEEVTSRLWAEQVLAAANLSARERMVLEMRLGFVSGSVERLRDVGAATGMSKEGARLAELRVLRKVRAAAGTW
jgi:RNA polymerase primary sigma factor